MWPARALAKPREGLSRKSEQKAKSCIDDLIFVLPSASVPLRSRPLQPSSRHGDICGKGLGFLVILL